MYAMCVILFTGSVGAYSSLSRTSLSCTQKRDEALKKQPPAIGAFVPQCTASGDYAKVQCYGSTGFCWCANPKTGQKIGEQVRGRPNC